jgi:hypothetical protein
MLGMAEGRDERPRAFGEKCTMPLSTCTIYGVTTGTNDEVDRTGEFGLLHDRDVWAFGLQIGIEKRKKDTLLLLKVKDEMERRRGSDRLCRGYWRFAKVALELIPLGLY